MNKLALNNAVLKILSASKRPEGSLQKGEIAFTTNEVQGGYQSQVQVSALPNEKAKWNFVGHPAATEKESIESAAAVALQTIMEDSELKVLHDTPKPERLGEDGLPLPNSKRQKTEAIVDAGAPPLPGGRHNTDTFKAILNNAVLKFVAGRNMRREEIMYTTTDLGNGQKQSQLLVAAPEVGPAICNIPFAGEVCGSEKDAINSAAEQMLKMMLNDPMMAAKIGHIDFESARAATAASSGRVRPRGAGGSGGGGGGGRASHKQKLEQTVLKIMKSIRGESGTLEKDDILYTTTNLGNDMMQSQVGIHCLPNALASATFAGEVASTEREAENNAADVAIQSIMADPELKGMYES